MGGNNLLITNPGGTSGNGWVFGRNTGGFAYDGVDTTAKDVMFTVVNANISSFKIKMGASNSSPTYSEVRKRSIYFKKFEYPNSFLLPIRTILSFSGNYKNRVVELKATLSTSHTFDKIIIERSDATHGFSPIGEVRITNASAVSDFRFTDISPLEGTSLYRLKLLNDVDRRMEISNSLVVKEQNGATEGLVKMSGNVIYKGSGSLSIICSKKQESILQVADMSGRILLKQKISLQEGNNMVNIGGISHFNSGYGIVMIVSKEGLYSNKVLFE